MPDSMKKERVVVICPGRGTYTKETLGYLRRFRPRFDALIAELDEARGELGQPSLSELDGADTFSPSLHLRGEHASALIFACAYADFLSLDRDRYDIVAVTGNSMGWYIALACAGVLDVRGAFDVINTMGSMMKDEVVGGQIIYPVVDEEWRRQAAMVDLVEQAMATTNAQEGCEVHVSIRLGGYMVIGGNQRGLTDIMRRLPAKENYPFQLMHHAAFHTPLLSDTSRRAFDELSRELFHAPRLPLVDGNGRLWQDYATDLDDLYRYTFDDQVVRPYLFSSAVTVALKEFNPDRLILLGPGNVLGGAIGQILVENRWSDITSKSEFADRQRSDPFLLSLGRP